jgi:hypothetical protein
MSTRDNSDGWELNRYWLSLLGKEVRTPKGKGVLVQYLGPKYVRVLLHGEERTTDFYANQVTRNQVPELEHDIKNNGDPGKGRHKGEIRALNVRNNNTIHPKNQV